MSFFSLKVTCSVCDGDAGLNRHRIADKKWMCSSCFKKANIKMGSISNPIKNMTVEDVKGAIEAQVVNLDELGNFTPTKKIGTQVEFDDDKQQWLILSPFLGKRNKSTVYKYSDILDFELLEDGESVSQGGLGRALVGGALFGGAGAIVGGVTGKKKSKGFCTSLRIKITLKDIDNPVEYIDFITTKTKKDGFLYKDFYNQAQECLSVFQLICDQQEGSDSSVPVGSNADEIRKFKELFDEGIITQEEFNAKKKELLGP